MFKITKTIVFVLCIIILFCVLEVFISQYEIETEIDEEIMQQREEIKKEINISENEFIWEIEIPKISLISKIQEGTSKAILCENVGHFIETSKEYGNIGLAIHSNINKKNNFEDLKLLKTGDQIIYKHNEFEKIYEVEKNRIIKSTEWKYLEAMDENILTIITKVKNYPEYRRCVQAVEKEADTY